MKIAIPFTKMSGAGNDFVIIDDRTGFLPADKPSLTRALCSRHLGIGADGLLILKHGTRDAMFMMEYYNADGSYGGMCGNGGRCIARYAFLKGLVPASMWFEALDHMYSASVDGIAVCLTMKNVAANGQREKIEVGTSTVEGQFINTGSPHFVVFVDRISEVDVVGTGRTLRSHPRFGSDGANIDFVQPSGTDSLFMRTYERGVEDETLACGTGAVASALALAIRSGRNKQIDVTARSGEQLSVSFKKAENTFADVVLTGSAHVLFTGKALFDGSSCSVSS